MSVLAIPVFPETYITGKSNCSSVASSSINKSKTLSTTSKGLALGLSILLITTIGFKLSFNALLKTNFV